MNKFLKVCAMALVFAGAINEVDAEPRGKESKGVTVEAEATVVAVGDIEITGKNKIKFMDHGAITSNEDRTIRFHPTSSYGVGYSLVVSGKDGIEGSNDEGFNWKIKTKDGNHSLRFNVLVTDAVPEEAVTVKCEEPVDISKWEYERGKEWMLFVEPEEVLEGKEIDTYTGSLVIKMVSQI